MRRLIGLVLSVSLAVLATAVPAAATVTAASDAATPAVSSDADAPPVVVLAAEEAEEQLGPDPMPREAEDNPARELAGYEDRDTPFTWGAAWILTFAGVVGLLLLVGLYHLLVRLPAREDAGKR